MDSCSSLSKCPSSKYIKNDPQDSAKGLQGQKKDWMGTFLFYWGLIIDLERMLDVAHTFADLLPSSESAV